LLVYGAPGPLPRSPDIHIFAAIAGELLTIRHAHFIGIAGAGMSAVAKLLRDSGVTVTGSDEGVYPPVSLFLQQEGIPYNTRYEASNLPRDADLIVIGKNARLVPETNAEVAAAVTSGVRIVSFPEVLSEISAAKETVVVAGAFGKSTSTSMLAHCLETLKAGEGTDPSYFIGAIPLTPATSARLGKGKLFVLEGDEYPSSNTDPRSKFLHYHPQHLIVTPLAHDHVNVFPTPRDYLAPFLQLTRLVPADGTIVYCVEGPLSRELMPRIRHHPLVTYGVSDGEYHAADIRWGEVTRFTLMHRGMALTEIETSQLGSHNIQNIVGVAAFLLTRGLASPREIAVAIKSFRGIRRRLDRKSEKTRLPIFEGFGSSYDKARSAIAAMKQHFPQQRLMIVFEPHTFSWRNREALGWYDDVFGGANKIYIYEPASQGAATHAQISQGEIVDRVLKAGFDAEPISDPDHALTTIGGRLRDDDVVLLLTSGNLGGLIEKIPRMAEQKFPL
jgi:UDP-N-acetylmuramate: L-alanyl-gamma-D-glutamyl-meso-diaminopimelate ligase